MWDVNWVQFARADLKKWKLDKNDVEAGLIASLDNDGARPSKERPGWHEVMFYDPNNPVQLFKLIVQINFRHVKMLQIVKMT